MVALTVDGDTKSGNPGQRRDADTILVTITEGKNTARRVSSAMTGNRRGRGNTMK